MSEADNRPMVSIGMPVYNGERYIRQALDSLLAQNYENFELIISDNASTDCTADICQEYLAKDKRILYYRNNENYGPVANFNRVLDLAKGEYFMWAACDDLWEPTYLETLLQSLITASGAVLAFSAFDNIDEHGREIKIYPDICKLPSEDVFERLRNYMTQEEHLGKANLIYGLMQRNALQQAVGNKVSGNDIWGEDMLVVFRLLSLGKVVLSKERLFHKRLVPYISNSMDEPSPEAFPHRVCMVWRTIQRWHGYFSGYAHLISIADSITFKEKTLLQIVLWKRASHIYCTELKATPPLQAIQSVLRRGRIPGF